MRPGFISAGTKTVRNIAHPGNPLQAGKSLSVAPEPRVFPIHKQLDGWHHLGMDNALLEKIQHSAEETVAHAKEVADRLEEVGQPLDLAHEAARLLRFLVSPAGR